MTAGLLVNGNVYLDRDSTCNVYSDTFEDTAAWTHPMTPYTCPADYGDLFIAGGQLRAVNANCGHFNYLYRTGIAIPDNNWKANLDFTPTAFGSGNGVGHILLA